MWERSWSIIRKDLEHWLFHFYTCFLINKIFYFRLCRAVRYKSVWHKLFVCFKFILSLPFLTTYWLLFFLSPFSILCMNHYFVYGICQYYYHRYCFIYKFSNLILLNILSLAVRGTIQWSTWNVYYALL